MSGDPTSPHQPGPEPPQMATPMPKAEQAKPAYGPPTVKILNPVEATPPTQGAVPYTANGTAKVNGNPPVTSMTYQVNDGQGKSIMPGLSGFTNWSFQLTAQDCPTVGTTYKITVNAWNNDGLGSDVSHLKRSS
jgi:hypothetical protein